MHRISIGLAVVLSSGLASADPAPLYEAELRLGYGVAMSGGGGMTSRRQTPLTITALAAIAVREEPNLFAFGGLVAETIDRNGVGATAGAQLISALKPGTDLRLSGGGTYLFAPYTLWGATGSVGVCKRAKIGLCGDVQLTAYFAGTDLAQGRTVTQVQAVMGLVFDAL